MIDFMISDSVACNSILVLTVVVLYFVYWLRTTYSYWSNRNVPQVKPTPILGEPELIFHRKSISEVFQGIYKQLDGHRFGGCYQLTKPTLLVREPELVKTILTKGFASFHDRNPSMDYDLNPLTANLFQLTGQKWKSTRQKIAPVFTAAKLKAMYIMMRAIAQELGQYLEGLVENEGGEIDAKNLMSKYTMDLMGACALGIKCNSIRNEPSVVWKVFKQLFVFDLRMVIVGALDLIHPKIASFLKLKIIPPSAEKFFLSLLKDSADMKKREDKKNDFFQYLMDLKAAEEERVKTYSQNGSNADPQENEEITFSDKIIAANLSALISAGFEPTSATLSFCLYELALNPDVQEKLFSEVSAFQKTHKGDFNFDDLGKFHYMECFINEILRKYPAAGVILRVCSESFQIPDTSVVIESGTRIVIPVLGLQRDPKYFPNPDVFDPDRFSEENKNTIQAGSYLPFGDGPRTCIGMRFALIEIKILLLTIVSKFSFHSTNKTPTSLDFDPVNLTLSPKKAIWLRFQKREDSVN